MNKNDEGLADGAAIAEEERLRGLIAALWQGGESEALASVEMRAQRNKLFAWWSRASDDLHKVLCEGAFKLDRDPMALMPLFRALQEQRVSGGWARDAVRRWLAGLPVDVPEYPTEDLTFDEADALDHLQRTAAGLEYDADGRAHILDTDVAYLNGAIHKLREKAADYEQEHAIRVNIAAQLLEAGNTIAALRQQLAALRANTSR